MLVRKMEIGGSERQTLELAKGLPVDRFDATILTFYPGGEFLKEAEEAGVKVVSLDKKGRWDLMLFFIRLVRELRHLKSDILYTVDGPPGILGLAARPFVRGLKVVWGIRASNMDLTRFDYSRQMVFRALKRLSGRVDLVIANSEFGRAYVVKSGFSAKNISVVHNGIDIDYFAPNSDDRTALRHSWGVASEVEALIGIVARLDPMKDHDTFLRAAAYFLERGGQARFVCVGDGPEKSRLQALANDLGLGGKVIWAGTRRDMPSVFAALDINTLTSVTEGFPNTLGEAMACATPCISTDVGDAASIMGELGQVVLVGNFEAIANAWAELVAKKPDERHQLGQLCRSRVQEHFSVQAMVEASIACYEPLMMDRR